MFGKIPKHDALCAGLDRFYGRVKPLFKVKFYIVPDARDPKPNETRTPKKTPDRAENTPLVE